MKHRPKYKRIIKAAVEVFAEHGYHTSQVSKIAKKAQVADGTIYLYFKNKEDLLISVFKEELGEFIEAIDIAILEKEDPRDKLLTLIRMHYEQLTLSPYLAKVTQLELRQSNPTLRKEINKVLKGYLDVIDLIIMEGIEARIFRTDANPKLIRQMIFGTIDESVTNWLMAQRGYDLREQVEDVHQLLMNGLAR